MKKLLTIFVGMTLLPGFAGADTLVIQRIASEDQFDAAVRISKLVYPFGQAGKYPYKAGAVILVNGHRHLEALVGASLIHHPRNGPILFAETNQLPKATRDEILRLAPSGIGSESQVLIVGGEDSISSGVESEVKKMGFTVSRIKGKDIFEMAAAVDKFLVYQGFIYHLVTKRDIIIFPEERKPETAIPASWIAHWDASVLFSAKDGLPPATKEAILARSVPPDVFVIGGEDVIPERIISEIKALPVGDIERISGKNPYEIAANFAKYQKDDFGWGYAERGSRAFVIGRAETESDIMGLIAASILGHLGKHAPVLLTDGQALDPATRDYLKSVRPYLPFSPANIAENHAYVLGNERAILPAVEAELHDLIAGDNNLAVVEAGIDKQTAAPGEAVKILLHLHNFNEEEARYDIPLKINGRLVETKQVTIEGIGKDLTVHDDESVEFVIRMDEPGEYYVDAAGFTAVFRVKPEGWVLSPLAGGGVLLGLFVILAGALSWGFVRRRAPGQAPYAA